MATLTRPRKVGPIGLPIDDRTLSNLTQVFHLMGDESRLRILLSLARGGEMHVAALCRMLEHSQPAVSHHLTLMRMAGLVGFRRAGKFNYYRLDDYTLGELLERLFADVGRARTLNLGEFSLDVFARPQGAATVTSLDHFLHFNCLTRRRQPQSAGFGFGQFLPVRVEFGADRCRVYVLPGFNSAVSKCRSGPVDFVGRSSTKTLAAAGTWTTISAGSTAARGSGLTRSERRQGRRRLVRLLAVDPLVVGRAPCRWSARPGGNRHRAGRSSPSPGRPSPPRSDRGRRPSVGGTPRPGPA